MILVHIDYSKDNDTSASLKRSVVQENIIGECYPQVIGLAIVRWMS